MLCHYFEIVEYKPMDGSILQLLLADIAGNFADEEGRKLLDMLFIIEDTLMAVGDLGSDLAYIVSPARRKPIRWTDSSCGVPGRCLRKDEGASE